MALVGLLHLFDNKKKNRKSEIVKMEKKNSKNKVIEVLKRKIEESGARDLKMHSLRKLKYDNFSVACNGLGLQVEQLGGFYFRVGAF